MRLREEPENQPPISVLGPDPLTHPLALETFAQALARIDAPIKAALLDQVNHSRRLYQSADVSPLEVERTFIMLEATHLLVAACY